MTLARKCEACGKHIDGKYIDLMITPKEASEEPSQDAEAYYGDYCFGCIEDGKAIADLLETIKKDK